MARFVDLQRHMVISTPYRNLIATREIRSDKNKLGGRLLGRVGGDRLDRDHPLGFCFLALIKPLDLGFIANGKVGGFDEGLSQVFVTILDVTSTLFLATHLFTVDTTIVDAFR